MARIVDESYIEELCRWIIDCNEHYEMSMSRVLSEIKEDLEKMPELVYCKDCKYNLHGGCTFEWELRQDSEDWSEMFCSQGVRNEI